MIRFIPLLFIFLYGCVHFPENVSLYGGFSEYKKSVDESTLIDNYSRYFDPLLTSNIDINNPSTASQLEFSKYMTREIGHYETEHNGKGCLTVNGVDSKNNPMAFYVEYKKSNNNWLISDIDVSFFGESNEYKNEALCPSQVRVQ